MAFRCCKFYLLVFDLFSWTCLFSCASVSEHLCSNIAWFCPVCPVTTFKKNVSSVLTQLNPRNPLSVLLLLYIITSHLCPFSFLYFSWISVCVRVAVWCWSVDRYSKSAPIFIRISQSVNHHSGQLTGAFPCSSDQRWRPRRPPLLQSWWLQGSCWAG